MFLYNIPVRNLDSKDLDKKGKICDSYAVKDLVVSVGKNDKMIGVDISALKSQINDLNFTEKEKADI